MKELKYFLQAPAMNKLTRKEKLLFLLPLLVPLSIWGTSFVAPQSTPTHLTHKDLVGTFIGDTPEGKQTLILSKNGNVKARLVDKSGRVYGQNTGSWKLVKTANGEQLDLMGEIAFYGGVWDKKEQGVYGGLYDLGEVNGKIVIYSRYFDGCYYEKQ
jgi:hypothetical protein